MDNSLKIEYIPIEDIKPYKNNAKLHPEEQIQQIKNSILEFGFKDPIAIWNDTIVEGHGRLLAAQELGYKELPVIRLDDLTDEQRKAYTLAHNKLTMNSDFDLDILTAELDDITDIDMSDFGFDLNLDEDTPINDVEHISLNDRFIVPPFSVLDTRQGYWQDRKKQWLSQGIESNLGRSQNLTFAIDKSDYMQTGCKGVAVQTSVFDPVLCEIMYKWFNVNNGTIYDRFAGGSVRGIIAEKLGYKYKGIDLRQEQIDENNRQAAAIGVTPEWYCDDSLNADKYIDDNSADMIFTCPPYANLEVYSDDKRDISNMSYDEFCRIYSQILSIACRKLKNDRFAVVVIGDVRDKKGAYRQLVDYTRKILTDNGLVLYNDFVLVEAVGTGAIRAPKQFNAQRKAIKTHQNVLVFYKGDIKMIKTNFETLNISEEDYSAETTE